MLRFEDPIYLWLLWIVPVMALLMLWTEIHRKKMLKRLGDLQIINRLMPDASTTRRWLKFALLQSAIVMVIIMIARPQMGTKVSHEKRNGIEAIICLDISNSMLAEDVAPSRLLKSKMLIENLVEHFTSDKVGLIVFAGDAFVQLPITKDYVSAKMFLQNIDPSLIQTQGTDIAQAINLASSSFTQQKDIGKAIIVITDGEDHEGGAMEAAKEAQSRGYKVFILGIGSPKGAPIPLQHGNGYMTDNSGNTVMTALNEQMCKEIAQAGSGTYIHVDNTSLAQEQLNDEIGKMQKGETNAVIYSEYNEQFWCFAIIALLLLIVETCISEAVNPFFRRFAIFRKKPGHAAIWITMLLALSFSSDLQAQSDRSHIRSGNRAMRSSTQDAASKAEISYRKALEANQNNPLAMYNLGCALMMQNKDATQYFTQAAQTETNKVRRAESYYSMGTELQKKQKYDEAIEMYKKTLRLMPHDNAARYNLALCQRQRNKHKDDDNSANNNQSNKDQNQDKDKDKKQEEDKKDGQDQNNQQKQPQNQQEQQMSQENAEQLLNAAMQEEKKAQQRIKKAMMQPSNRRIQKNW